MTLEQRVRSPMLSFVFRAGLAGFAMTLLAGCDPLIIVDVDVEVQISGRDAQGSAWQAPPEQIQKSKGPSGASPFGTVRYKGKIFSWIIGVWDTSLGVNIRSNVSSDVCFRFDQARLTSSMQSKEIPLKVYFVSQNTFTQQIVLKGDSRLTGTYDPPRLCFGREGAAFGLAANYEELFPSGKLFNINQSGKDLTYSKRGAGEWLKLHVPIDYEGKREDLEITFFGKGSEARSVYI